MAEELDQKEIETNANKMNDNLKKIKLHPENPIEISKDNLFEHDHLGFKDSVVRLSQIINNIETPFTLGIFGSWGSGKTSFMKLLQAHLKNESNFVTFWFNAWQYENETSLLLPLLSKMANEHIKHEELINSVKKIATGIVLTGSDALLKGLTFGNIKLGDIEKNLKFYEEEVGNRYNSWVSEIDSLESEFKNLVKKIKKGKPALIIFIDDLDRCLPENVIRLIENIKHFLSVEGCIFILGVDKEVLSKGIEARYGSKLISGEEYLEKIVNFSLSIRQKSDLTCEDYVVETAKKFVEDEWFKMISDRIRRFAEIVSTLGVANPRKLKLLVIRYLFFLSLSDSNRYIEEIVITLIVYREFFFNAYIIKKEHYKVDYFPSITDNSGNFLTFEVIEKKSCKDFAEIATNRAKYLWLREFRPNTKYQIGFAFNEKPDDQLKKGNKQQTSTELKKAMDELIKKKYMRKHSDYFELIDFLFSLS